MTRYLRGISIVWVALRYGLDELVLNSFQRPWLSSLARVLSFGRDLTRAARPAPAPGAGAPGPDLRQVRAGAVDAARPAARGRGRRTRAAAGPRAAVPFQRCHRHHRARLPPAGGHDLRELRTRAGGQRLDRAGALRHADRQGRDPARRRREGAAPGHAAGDRERPEPDAHDGGLDRAALRRRPAPEAARGGRRVRQVPARRAGPGARGGQRRPAAPQHGAA